MKYKFKAIRANGEKYEGEKEADSKFALYEAIKKEGGSFLHVEEVKDRKSHVFKMPQIFNQVKMVDKIQFAKNLGVMIEAGLPITRAISVMERQSRNKAFKKVLVALSADIVKGESLSAAMEKHPDAFSKLFLSMVRSGEESGSLTTSLKSVGDQLEKVYLLNKKVKGAMIYPAIILCIMVAIAILMLIFVVPTLSSVFKELNVQLPLMTRLVIGTSDFLKNHFIISFLVLIGAGVGGYYFKRSARGKVFFDMLSLKMPIINGIVKETNAARTARTLTSLLSSGVDILVAIRITSDVVQNGFYKKILKKAEVAVEKGNPISGVFIAEEKLYPAFVGEMASIGEETGKLAEMFANIATFYEGEVDQKTKDFSTIIEPFLMVFIGLAVGFFAISMLTPIYSLVDTI